ncbi:MAG TPA: RMD1 family protein [Burkholderiales bacterium]|nr:RMD1 family protein [Burkholderiales bacterium]
MPLRPDFKARALLVAERIDLRAWKDDSRIASNPLAVAVPGGGLAVLFRYGVVVFFDVTEPEEAAFLAQIRPLAEGPLAAVENEEVEIRVEPRTHEGMRGERVYIAQDDIERLQIVADVLSKSVVLAYYEAQIAESFDRVEPLAAELRRRGRIPGQAAELVRDIGAMLLTEHMMVGRVAVAEKPELLWERPELEGLFIRLEDEFEIRERQEALGRKLDLIAHTAQTLIQLRETRHLVRLELYIVILILIEIVLMSYELFFWSP